MSYICSGMLRGSESEGSAALVNDQLLPAVIENPAEARLAPAGDTGCASGAQAADQQREGRELSVAPNRDSVVQIAINPTLRKLLDNRWVVYGLLATVGPMGLPALWFSRRFSPGVKITLTILFFVLTVLLPLAVSWYFLDVYLRPLTDALGPAMP